MTFHGLMALHWLMAIRSLMALHRLMVICPLMALHLFVAGSLVQFTGKLLFTTLTYFMV